MSWLTGPGQFGWLNPGDTPQLVVLSLVAVLIAVDTLPFVGLAVPGDLAVVTVVTVVGVCAGPSVILAVTSGSLLGWSVGYLLGRRFARRRPRGAGWLSRQLARTDQVLTGRGERMLALAPFLPVVNALAPVAAGAAGVRFRRMLAFAATGSAAWASLYTLIGIGSGAGLGRVLGTAEGPFVQLLPVLVAVPMSVLAGLIARRALRSLTTAEATAQALS